MRIFMRVVGVILVLLGMANLAALFLIDIDDLISPTAVIVRYSLMAIAGVGFLLLKKWGIFIYLGSLAINWINYYTVYGGQGSSGPLWLSVPIPVGIVVLCYFAWSNLR